MTESPENPGRFRASGKRGGLPLAVRFLVRVNFAERLHCPSSDAHWKSREFGRGLLSDGDKVEREGGGGGGSRTRAASKR